MSAKLNRKIPPPIRPIEKLVLPRPEVLHLDNGIPVYVVDMGAQEVLKLEVAFRAGRPHEQKRLAARATSKLLKEGTLLRSAAEIAETCDFYGASLTAPYNLDSAAISLFCLSKHFDRLLPIVAEVLYQPAFLQKELDTFIETSKQNLAVDLSKVDTVAYRALTELIFGENHPYGYNSFPETYDALTRDDLLYFYDHFLTDDHCQIFLSGKLHPGIFELLNQHLGQRKKTGLFQKNLPPIPDQKPSAIRIPHPGAIQSAVKIGCHLFNRHHPDYKGLSVLNTLLGGYFSSRLMMNIRETKGYTYNIYSALDPMLEDGCFYIGTETGSKFTEKVIREIYREMEKLQQEPVGEAELEMLRNYLLGNLLTMLDGAFNIGDVVKLMVVEGLPFSEFETTAETIRSITPARLQELAQQYFDKNRMWEVVVG